jgi:hypothetical protein
MEHFQLELGKPSIPACRIDHIKQPFAAQKARGNYLT